MQSRTRLPRFAKAAIDVTQTGKSLLFATTVPPPWKWRSSSLTNSPAARADSRKPQFLSLEGAYHGDTVGAVRLGHIDLFHKAYAGLLFKTDTVMSPYCYRCPFNRASPERADARDYRKCNWECVGKLEQKFAAAKEARASLRGFVFEPLMQGAAGMIPQPAGWLRRAAEIARGHGALLIADEVMTGFGRAGISTSTELAFNNGAHRALRTSRSETLLRLPSRRRAAGLPVPGQRA